MKPLGILLDFTRLYVYVHWMFRHFFLVDEILAKSTILLMLEVLYMSGHLDR